MKLVQFTVTIVAPDNWEDNDFDAACDTLDGFVAEAAIEIALVDMIANNDAALAGCKVVITETA